MKPIELVSNGKDSSILRTKDRNGYPYDLYYINSKEDLFRLKEVVDNFIQEKYIEKEDIDLSAAKEMSFEKEAVNQNSSRLFSERIEIETECIMSYGYIEDKKILDLEFNSGGDYIYRYYNVPKEVVTRLLKEKNGKYFNKHVRGIYNFYCYDKNGDPVKPNYTNI